MKKTSLLLVLLLLLLLTACRKVGPDLTALPTLETAPDRSQQQGGSYHRGDAIIVHEEELFETVQFTLYEDGRLVLTGGDLTESIVDTQAYRDFKSSITIVEIGEGVTVVGEKVFAKADNIQKVEVA